MQNQSNSLITFDTQLKTVLYHNEVKCLFTGLGMATRLLPMVTNVAQVRSSDSAS